MKKAAIVIIVLIIWTAGSILLRKYSIIGGDKSSVETSKQNDIKESKAEVEGEETSGNEAHVEGEEASGDEAKEDEVAGEEASEDEAEETGEEASEDEAHVEGEETSGNEAEEDKTQVEEDGILYQIPVGLQIMREHYTLDNAKVKETNDKLKAVDELVEKSMNSAALEENVTREEIILRVHHMKRVSDLAMELMVNYEEEEGVSFSLEEAECLMFAAYTHDICKFEDGNHAKLGSKYVRENIAALIQCTQQQAESIGLLIRYHSDPLSPDQKEKLGHLVVLEELLQDADMIDKIRNKGATEENNIEALHFDSSREVLTR